VRIGLSDALADLARAFRALGVRWSVFGAQAVAAAGAPRFTEDIDVMVEIPRAGTRALVRELEKVGVALRELGTPKEVSRFIKETRVVPARHRASGLAIDVVLTGPGIEEEMLERSVERLVGRLRVPFIETNDLIVLKVLAGRPRDLEDVRSLLRAAPSELSVAEAKTRIDALGSMLDDSTLAATFDDLVRDETKPRRRAMRRRVSENKTPAKKTPAKKKKK
jgi:hypothetical protein